MNKEFNLMQVEAAVQHAIRIGWKPEAKLGEEMGEVNISFVELPPEFIRYVSKYIPNINDHLYAALSKAAEEIDLTDIIVGCEWSNNGAEIVTSYIYDRVMQFNRTHRSIFKNYFTNYVINGKWAPFLEYDSGFSKTCYKKVMEMAEASPYVEPVKSINKLARGKLTMKSGELVFTDDKDINRQVRAIIEKCTKDFIHKNVEIMIQIKGV